MTQTIDVDGKFSEEIDKLRSTFRSVYHRMNGVTTTESNSLKKIMTFIAKSWPNSL